jgi:hypothetical protein
MVTRWPTEAAPATAGAIQDDAHAVAAAAHKSAVAVAEAPKRKTPPTPTTTATTATKALPASAGTVPSVSTRTDGERIQSSVRVDSCMLNK